MIGRVGGAVRSRARLLRLLGGASARRIRVAHDPVGAAVEVLDLEECVTGALSAESRPQWEAEALRAIAIASRTHALWRMLHPRHARYDLLVGTDQFWAPPGLADGRHVSSVRRTRGTYLVRRSGRAWTLRPSLTQFHESCGGSTDTPTAVWGGAGEGSAVVCPPCQADPRPWSSRIDRDVLLRSVGMAGAESGSPLSMEVLERSPSGRILRLRIGVGDHGVALSGEAFRAALGHGVIRSALLHWEIGSHQVAFEGRGHGHGAGLCQLGAVTLARLGWSAEAILAHYYPGSRLRRLRDS